jgi:hypothetical protein
VQVTAGKLMVNGTPIREPYAQGLGPDYGPETLGADAYFLLADHRDQPDSRSWGPVTRKNLFGSASFIRGDSLTSMVSVVHAPFSKQLDALP